MNVISDFDASLIATIDVFANMDAEGLAKLKAQGQIREYAIAEIMLSKNDSAEDIFFLLSGEAQVQIPGTGFISLQQGEVVGESSLVEGEHFLPPGWRLNKRNATVVAKTDLRALVFQADNLSLLLRQYPEVRQALADIAASRTSD